MNMKDTRDYLWDGSGEPDPEVEQLETMLSRFRHQRQTPPELPQRKRFEFRLLFPQFAAVAALVMMAIGLMLFTPGQPGWDVVSLEGAPQVGEERIGEAGRLTVGEYLRTDDASRARIHVGLIGQVEVEPNSRLQLLEARNTEHRLSLERGKMHAYIWAPPRMFFVNTPSAVAVDLGCAYTLEVDERGAGLLYVKSGWVAFQNEGRESFVPANAMAVTRPGSGPGTPYFADAAPELRDALVTLDFEQTAADQRRAALDAVLTKARARDGLTLWHLLSRLDGAERGRIYDRMAALVPPPAAVTRAGVLRGDQEMLDAWWNALGHGSTSWWRMWKGPWPPRRE